MTRRRRVRFTGPNWTNIMFLIICLACSAGLVIGILSLVDQYQRLPPQ